mgnify:CR=1 FL=1
MPTGCRREIVGPHRGEFNERRPRLRPEKFEIHNGALRQMLVERNNQYRSATFEKVLRQQIHVDRRRTWPNRTDDNHRAFDEVPVTVQLQPIQGGRSRACTVDSR